MAVFQELGSQSVTGAVNRVTGGALCITLLNSCPGRQGAGAGVASLAGLLPAHTLVCFVCM